MRSNKSSGFGPSYAGDPNGSSGGGGGIDGDATGQGQGTTGMLPKLNAAALSRTLPPRLGNNHHHHIHFIHHHYHFIHRIIKYTISPTVTLH